MLPKMEKLFYVHHLTSFCCARHTHPKHEYVYCIQGDGKAELRGQSFYFGTGTICVNPAGMPHEEIDDTESKIIYFYFDADEEDLCPGIFQDKDGSVLAILRRLQSESHGTLPQTEKMKSAILLQLLIETKRLALGPRSTRGFEDVLKYIDENYCYKQLSIRELAKQSGYSYDRLRHIFKEKTGMSPVAYINDKRISLAKKLIENGAVATLTYIAYECGFTSSSQFANAFKAKTGISPLQYRKKYTQK